MMSKRVRCRWLRRTSAGGLIKETVVSPCEIACRSGAVLVLDTLANGECDRARRHVGGATMSDIRTLVDGVSAAWNNHDAPGFAAQYSENAMLRVIATGDVLHGRGQLRAVAEAYLRAF